MIIEGSNIVFCMDRNQYTDFCPMEDLPLFHSGDEEFDLLSDSFYMHLRSASHFMSNWWQIIEQSFRGARRTFQQIAVGDFGIVENQLRRKLESRRFLSIRERRLILSDFREIESHTINGIFEPLTNGEITGDLWDKLCDDLRFRLHLCKTLQWCYLDCAFGWEHFRKALVALGKKKYRDNPSDPRFYQYLNELDDETKLINEIRNCIAHGLNPTSDGPNGIGNPTTKNLILDNIEILNGLSQEEINLRLARKQGNQTEKILFSDGNFFPFPIDIRNLYGKLLSLLIAVKGDYVQRLNHA